MAPATGAKGYTLEELLKAYFSQAGYFAVRGIPYRLEGEDVTDVDLWLYERPAALMRRRIIVDAKNRKSPKVAERLIWASGLKAALGVDGAIVATTDKRPSARSLAASLGVILLDGDAVTKLGNSEQLRNTGQLTSEALREAVRTVDRARRTDDWRLRLEGAMASLIKGIGPQSTNTNLSVAGYFADQAAAAQPVSDQAKAAIRLFYLSAAFTAISLDYLLAEQAFRSHDARRSAVIGSIRFGNPDGIAGLSSVNVAIGLARKYAANGNAVAKQIETGFSDEAAQIPAEIVADYVARIASSDALFVLAREIEKASLSVQLPSFDELSTDLKSFLGVVLDFNGVSRERVALAWPRGAGALPKAPPPSGTAAPVDSVGPLFTTMENDRKP